MKPNPIDTPGLRALRQALRVVGPLVWLTGLVFVIVGLTSFFRAFGSFGGVGDSEFPRYFWCVLVGLPLLGLGGFLTLPAYAGTIARFLSGSVAPVQADTFKYMAGEVAPGVRDLARAVGEGIAEAQTGPTAARGPFCPSCGKGAPVGSKFCPACGAALAG